MINLDQVEIKRLKDKASPTNAKFLDKLRAWRILLNSRITAGQNVTFKRGVKISIPETGKLSFGDYCFIHENVYFLLTMPKPEVKIGKWVFIGRNTVIASKNLISIGDYTVFAPNCYIVDHEHGFSKSDVILNQKSVLKEVKIGRDRYFGAGAIILGGVTVGDGAVIGASSIVTRSIPPYEIWAGNPAKFIKPRD